MRWNQPRAHIPPYFNANPPKRRLGMLCFIVLICMSFCGGVVLCYLNLSCFSGSADFFFVNSPPMYQLAFFLRYSVPATLLNTLAAFGSKTYKDKVSYIFTHDLIIKLLWCIFPGVIVPYYNLIYCKNFNLNPFYFLFVISGSSISKTCLAFSSYD